MLLHLNSTHDFWMYCYLTDNHYVVRRPFNKGRSLLPSNLFSFFVREPYLVIPNFPSESVWSSFVGITFQLRGSTLTSPVKRSNSLSQLMHFTFFLVRRAYFSFSSSSLITKMISLILAYMNSRAFLTSSLSHFVDSKSDSYRYLYLD
jgi:hypothetical protein